MTILDNKGNSRLGTSLYEQEGNIIDHINPKETFIHRVYEFLFIKI